MINFSEIKNHEFKTHDTISESRKGHRKNGEILIGTSGTWFQPLIGASFMRFNLQYSTDLTIDKFTFDFFYIYHREIYIAIWQLITIFLLEQFNLAFFCRKMIIFTGIFEMLPQKIWYCL